MFRLLNSLIITSCILGINAQSLDLKKIIKSEDFYQVTLFVSENITNTPRCINMSSFDEFPVVLYSFFENRQSLYHSTVSLKRVYSLQASLVILYACSFNEANWFLYFLKEHLAVRKIPKCLIIYSVNNFTGLHEVKMMFSLNYAWEMNFLDLTYLMTNNEEKNLSTYVYYLNPFSGVVFKREMHDDIVIFPDKLKNGFGYEIYVPHPSRSRAPINKFIRKTNQKDEIYIGNLFYINFILKTSNYQITMVKTGDVIILTTSYLLTWNLDMHSVVSLGGHYLYYFYVPADEPSSDVVAFVPIIHSSHTNIFLKMFRNFVVIFTIVSVFLLIVKFFSATTGLAKAFDFVRLIFGQSIAHEPQKTLHRIIVLTIVAAAVKITNDFLLDAVMVQYENEEMPFESYEDLYNSKLQTYTIITFLKDPKFLEEKVRDPHLLEILNRTTIVNSNADMKNCFTTLKKWKNVSCIGRQTGPEMFSSDYLNSDGSATVKVAQPPLYSGMMFFYWFARNSPYAMRFLETLRRIKETNLIYWPALVHNNKSIDFIADTKPTINASIKSENLLITLGIGYSVGIVAFITEKIAFNLRKFKTKFISNGRKSKKIGQTRKNKKQKDGEFGFVFGVYISWIFSDEFPDSAH